MAWYRCMGGSGLPAGLQTDMDAVLNKKFSTSTTYPPADWPDTVNLMGPLPERTASGAIASFSDGADDVPVKSCTVSFVPSGGGGTPSSPVAIVGCSGLSVTQLGGNLLENTATSDTVSDVTFTVNSDGSVSLSGTASAEINFNIYSNFTFPKTGDYFISGCPNGGSTSTYRIFATNYGSDTGSGLSVNVTNLATKTTICINIKSGTNTTGLTFKPMISVGSSATTYTPYVTPSVVTDTFGQTLYGGSRDLVTEKASVTYGMITFDGSNDEVWQKHGSIASWFYIDNAITDGYVIANENNFMVCNEGTQEKYVTVAQMTNGQFAFGQPSATTFRFVFKNTDFTEVTDFKTWLSNNPMTIAYKLSTPTEITGLTAHNISTRLGDNNFYADTGTMSVEYRADIDLLLGGN